MSTWLELPQCNSSDESDSLLREKDVSPSHWCVDRSDLEFFTNEVRSVWEVDGIPVDPLYADSAHYDKHIGPTVYSVNEHFIKPRTRDAGTSWALMVNPEGLPCHIFASHSWAEGIFEFSTKMLRNWPRMASNLYVCFLSNPQNADLREVLGGDPLESPFARALQRATYVYVIPNQRRSVYSRLWCVFEAHLAMQLDKPVVLPGEGYSNHVCCLHVVCVGSFAYGAMLRLSIYLLLGGNYVLKAFDPIRLHDIELFLLVGGFPWIIFHGVKVFWYFPSAISVGLTFVTGWVVMSTLCTLSNGGAFEEVQNDIGALGLIIPLMSLSWASMSNLQRALSASRYHEEQTLLEFSSVRNASSTDPIDEQNIRKAIAGLEDQIDHAILMMKKVGRYSGKVKFNLQRGMRTSTVRLGVFHSLFLAYSYLWAEGMVGFWLQPWQSTLLSTMLTFVALVLVVTLGDLANFFAEMWIFGASLLYVLYELLSFAVHGRSFSWSAGRKNDTQDLGYFTVWLCVMVFVVILPCVSFYTGIYGRTLTGIKECCKTRGLDGIIDWSDYIGIEGTTEAEQLEAQGSES